MSKKFTFECKICPFQFKASITQIAGAIIITQYSGKMFNYNPLFDQISQVYYYAASKYL